MGSKICMNVSCGTTTTLQWKRGWVLRSGDSANLCYDCGHAFENLVYCETFHMNDSGWRDCTLCNKRLHCGCIASKSLVEFLDFGGVGCVNCSRTPNYIARAIQRSRLLGESSSSKDEIRGLWSTFMSSDDIERGKIKQMSDLDLKESIIRQNRNISILSTKLPDKGEGLKAKLKLLEEEMESRWLERLQPIQKAIPSSEVSSSKDQFGGLWSALLNSDGIEKGMNVQFNKTTVDNESNYLAQSHKGDSTSIGKIKREVITSIREVCAGFPDMTHLSVGSSQFALLENSVDALGVKTMPLAHPSLSMSLGASPNFVPHIPDVVEVGEEIKAVSPFQRGQRPRHILPKVSKTSLTIGLEPNGKGLVHHGRVPRPPAEGRSRNQLLPRYWPRITDQELQQLSGDLNSTIVPLFEKVLSASDAGRIGRLVLPKACAEAYFPSISQSEGLPLKIQDVKGKEWTFQFRFWPNNNSRMYVLEGVTPCIQSMDLQAGDTVTFSRIDPGGKLVMGFRKATNSFHMQDAQTSVIPTAALLVGESLFHGDTENIPSENGYSRLLQSLKGNNDPHVGAPSEHITLADGNVNSQGKHKHEIVVTEKRSQNTGFKSKRLRMHNEDSLELRVTWEEAQELLRPPPSVKPNIVMVEDYEFEEYDVPPVFGKKTVFITGLSGEQEQWTQCDDCSKWRMLPIDVLLPPKWTCSDNIWDLKRMV